MGIVVLFGAMAVVREIVDPTSTDPTPLETAASWGTEKDVRELLASGYRYDDTQMKLSAVYFAARGSDPGVIEALVEYGAPVHRDSRDGYLFAEAVRVSWDRSDDELRTATVPVVNRLLDLGFMPCVEGPSTENISSNLAATGVGSSPEGQRTLERIIDLEQRCADVRAPGFVREYQWWIVAWLLISGGVIAVLTVFGGHPDVRRDRVGGSPN